MPRAPRKNARIDAFVLDALRLNPKDPWAEKRAVIAKHRMHARAARQQARYDVDALETAAHHDAEAERLEAELEAAGHLRPRGARYRANPHRPDGDAIAIATEILQQTGSLTDAIDMTEQRGGSIPLVYGVPQKSVVDTLRSWVPAPLPSSDDDVDVFHATDKATAEQILREGVIPQLKPMTLARARYEAGEPAVFSPGKGLSGGIYVGVSPREVESYGEVTLRIRVPRRLLKVSPEQASLGVEDVEESLAAHDGAVILQAIPPENIEAAHKERRRNPHRPDGDAIAAWCASDESYAVLDETSAAGSSWMAGACVLLAKAIRKRYPEARLVGIGTVHGIQHVGARIGDTVYDALGEHDPHAWVRDWLAYEQLPARTLARVASLAGVPRSELPDAESPATPADVALVARALP